MRLYGGLCMVVACHNAVVSYDARAVPADAAPPPILDTEVGMPAWSAVVARDTLLARRGASGLVRGCVYANAESRWLIDHTEGEGRLAVRLGGVELPSGRCVMTRGAWRVDAERRWIWHVSQFADRGPGENVNAAPGLVVANGPPPTAPVPITSARDGDVISFMIIGPPVRVGDGWPIAEYVEKTARIKVPPAADVADAPMNFLVLPGERESYGGRDLRVADEAWHLEVDTRYWVKLSKVRRKGVDTLTAESGPSRW